MAAYRPANTSCSACRFSCIKEMRGRAALSCGRCKIATTDSAGIFQIDQLLKPRIEHSGLHDLIHVIAEVVGGKEACVVKRFEV